MTIVIPVWVITLAQTLGITIVIVFAIIGVYFLSCMLGAKWWI
jgi:hypothetical protein